MFFDKEKEVKKLVLNEGCEKMDGRKRVGKGPPFTDELNADAEHTPPLEAVTSERLVKAHLAGKILTCPVVICELGRVLMAI
jgi:hypothetical protein